MATDPKRLEYLRAWYARNPGKHTAYMREWRRQNLDKVRERNRRRRESGLSKQQALVARYGISVEDREAMLDAQGRACAICRAPEPGWKHYWTVDHCHATGRVRGILCHSCNIVLGRVKDSPETLRAMIKYLGGAVT